MSTPAVAQRRILVVDDEPLVCDALKMMLEFDGHLVTKASSAAEGLRAFDLEPFDMVITDFEMPEIKGDQFARAIKARKPGQPVVLITAYAEMLAGKDLDGVDLMLSKPFLLDSLRDAVNRLAPAKSPARGSRVKS